MISDEPWDIKIHLTDANCPYKSNRMYGICGFTLIPDNFPSNYLACSVDNCIWAHRKED